MNTIRSFTQNHALITFFGLAYALSWWPNLFGMGTNNPFGPLLAALLVVWLSDGKAGLAAFWKYCSRWRGPWGWYVLAIVLPFAVNLAAAALTVALGAPYPSQESILRWPELFITFPLYLIVFGPLGEEPGWRGFAMPRLQAGRSALVASLILGLLIAIWHLPLVAGGQQSATILLAIVAVQVVYTWLANHVEGKVLIVMLAHAAQGGLGGEYFGPMFSGEYAQMETWMLVVVQCVVAVVIVAFTGVRLTRRAEAEPVAA